VSESIFVHVLTVSLCSCVTCPCPCSSPISNTAEQQWRSADILAAMRTHADSCFESNAGLLHRMQFHFIHPTTGIFQCHFISLAKKFILTPYQTNTFILRIRYSTALTATIQSDTKTRQRHTITAIIHISSSTRDL